MAIPFTKMHGNGNDFVVIDGRQARLALDRATVRAMADRRRGIGFDQLVVIETPQRANADIFLRFYNADGGESAACGNGTRCVAGSLMQEMGRDDLVVETAAGMLTAWRRSNGLVAVDMGFASTDWNEVPLAAPADTLHLDLTVEAVDGREVAGGPLLSPVAVGIGNPHCVFFVEDAEAVDLALAGPVIEHHPMFPQRTNVEVANVMPDGRIRLRVWERGAGITEACGTGACATLVAANRRNLSGRAAELILDGGLLHAEWREDGHVVLTGPIATSFTGTLGEVPSMIDADRPSQRR